MESSTTAGDVAEFFLVPKAVSVVGLHTSDGLRVRTPPSGAFTYGGAAARCNTLSMKFGLGGDELRVGIYTF